MRKNYQSIFKKIFKSIFVFLFSLILLTACNYSKGEDYSDYNKDKQIYLYGEIHGQEDLVALEYELWHSYYHQHGMRNLFLELANFEAGLLNLWMDAEDDEILDILGSEYASVPGVGYYKDMLIKIKKECPETVFYGTDISHFSENLGNAYLNFLDADKADDALEIERVREVMEAGTYRNEYLAKYLNSKKADFHIRKMADFREDKLTEYFIYEYEKLKDNRIMGIYGSYHLTNPTNLDMADGEIMGDRLIDHYGDRVFIKVIAGEEHFNKRWEQ